MKNKQKQSIKYFSVGKCMNSKQKNISHNALKSPNCSGIQQININDKSDQDLKWLEKLVTGFQWYKIKKDTLFADDGSHVKSIKNGNDHFGKCLRQSSGIMRKNSNRDKQACNDSKQNIKIPLKQNTKVMNSTITKNVNNNNKNAKNKSIYMYRGDKVEAKVQTFRNKDSGHKSNRNQTTLKSNTNIQKQKNDENQNPSEIKLQINSEVQCKKDKNDNDKAKQQLDEEVCTPYKKRENLKRGQQYDKFNEKQKNYGIKQKQTNKTIGRIVKNAKSVQERKFYQASSVKNKPYYDNKNKPQIYVQMDGPVTQTLKNDNQVQIKSIRQNNQSRQARQRRIESLKKQLNFNKYQYYIEGTANPLNFKLQQKRQQRKLNCSVGFRNTKSQKQLICQRTIKKPINIENSNQNQTNSIMITDKDQSNRLLINHQDHKMLQNLPLSKLKLVVSTKNSAIMTQQNSQVLMKITQQQFINQPIELSNRQSTQIQNQQEWNVIKIFKKLDRKKLGILNADNCAIQSLSRELRYIFGSILEQILYSNQQMNLQQFIAKVGDSLTQTNYQQNKQRYLSLKNLAAETQRLQSTNQLQQLNIQIKQKNAKQYQLNKQSQLPYQRCFKLSKNKKQKTQQKSFRFATFQNQSDQQSIQIPIKQQNIQDIKIEDKSPIVECAGISRQKGLEIELEKKLSNIDKQEIYNKFQIKKQYETVNDQSLQIQKLERLNKRLQKYLIDQSITKLEGSDKLYY